MDRAVELNLPDFPEYLGDVIRSYFEKTYPGDHIVVRYHPTRTAHTTVRRSPSPVRSPVKSARDIGETAYMPPELVSKIMRGNERTALKGEQLAKSVRGTSEEFDYGKICSKPITTGEVIRELPSGGVVLSKTGKVRLSGGNERIFKLYNNEVDLAMVWTYPKVVSQEGNKVTISARTLIAERVNETTFSFYKLSREDSPLLHLDTKKSLKENGVEVDLFTAYRIAKNRRLCMKNDPRYADETIIDMYNELNMVVGSSFEKRRNTEDTSEESSSFEDESEDKPKIYRFSLKIAQKVLLYNYILTKLSKKVTLIEGVYDANEEKFRKVLTGISRSARNNIKKEIFGLVSDVKGSTELYLD